MDCASYPQGLTANVTGLTTVGGKTVLVIVGVTWTGITVSVDGHFYTNSAVTTGTASATGGHWNGDVTDQSTGTTLHVAGDATCGSSTKTQSSRARVANVGKELGPELPLETGRHCEAVINQSHQSAGGATPPVPSVADVFFVGFFPPCYLSLAILLRREMRGTRVTAWLDRAIAGLGVGSIFAAFVVHPVLKAVGGLSLSSATTMAYPVGDLLLLAVVAGGLAVVSKGRRRVLVVAGLAIGVNLVGDTYSLLQPDSKAGYIANAAAWPTPCCCCRSQLGFNPPPQRMRARCEPGVSCSLVRVLSPALSSLRLQAAGT